VAIEIDADAHDAPMVDVQDQYQRPADWRISLATEIVGELTAGLATGYEDRDWVAADDLRAMLGKNPRWDRCVMPTGRLSVIDMVNLMSLIKIRGHRVRNGRQGGRRMFFRIEDIVRCKEAAR